MEILADKVVKFSNEINSKDWIDLIEKTSEVYPFKSVDRRPHLTMELPNLLSDSDSDYAAMLRSNFIKKIFNPISSYMSMYNIDNMTFKKNFITVSKLTGGDMGLHRDDKQENKDNFICMFYINGDFEGGEISFPDFDLTYKPVAGDILIYQSKFRHAVLNMEPGLRYSIGMGFKGPMKHLSE
jgi:hypothetical protein